jgi:hypothetical protein
MENWIVEYFEGSIPQYFHCLADDSAHAIEQFKSAYPDCEANRIGQIVWMQK